MRSTATCVYNLAAPATRCSSLSAFVGARLLASARSLALGPTVARRSVTTAAMDGDAPASTYDYDLVTIGVGSGGAARAFEIAAKLWLKSQLIIMTPSLPSPQ